MWQPHRREGVEMRAPPSATVIMAAAAGEANIAPLSGPDSCVLVAWCARPTKIARWRAHECLH